jgi:hypothetical protein
LYNRDLLLIYIAAIAILWNLWFFGFWSVSIIGDAAQSSFLQAALTAAFNAGAGILGFPAGGWLADYAKRKGWGRKTMLVSFTLIQGLLTLAFGFYIMNGGQSVLVLGALLFTASLFFNALQPMSHAMTADLVPSAAYLGAAFGLWKGSLVERRLRWLKCATRRAAPVASLPAPRYQTVLSGVETGFSSTRLGASCSVVVSEIVHQASVLGRRRDIPRATAAALAMGVFESTRG